jgi:CHASE2 domain-containing sensor protein
MRWKIGSSSKKKELETRGISLLERAIKSLPAILIGICLTFFLSRSGIFRQLETYALDTQVRLQGAERDSNVAVVLIDDEDYANLFEGKSPLNHTSLEKLINAIAAGKPRVIGIDVDTSAPQFRDLKLPAGGPVIVWAQAGSFSHRDDKYHLTNLLGGQQVDAKSGIVVMRLDSDGAIRRYPRMCETNKGALPSFPWVVASQFDPNGAGQHSPSEDNLFIKFAGDNAGSHRVHFTASRVLSLADGPGWQTDSPIKDKIVLLGGAYGSEDEHDTPLGWMLGVEVLAYAVDTELLGGGTKPASPILVTILGGFVGLLLLLFFQHFRPAKAILISLLTVPILGALSSLVAFRSMAFWAYFVPIPLAVLTQEIYHHAKDYRMRLIKQLYQGVVGKGEEEES